MKIVFNSNEANKLYQVLYKEIAVNLTSVALSIYLLRNIQKKAFRIDTKSSDWKEFALRVFSLSRDIIKKTSLLFPMEEI